MKALFVLIALIVTAIGCLWLIGFAFDSHFHPAGGSGVSFLDPVLLGVLCLCGGVSIAVLAAAVVFLLYFGWVALDEAL